MAKQVFTTEEIELQNGDVVELRPLNIKNLRLFNAKLKEMQKPDLTEEEGLDVLVELCGVCVSSKLPELVADRTAFEEALDIDTIYKIIEVCGGIKLNDPNLQAAALAMME